MVEKIGRDSALAREAMRAAQRLAGERAAPPLVRPSHMGPPEAAGTQATDFTQTLEGSLHAVDDTVKVAEHMPIDLLTGKVDDFHEIAVQLKSAELSFKFAMEIRNKLVDAYREIMRMSI